MGRQCTGCQGRSSGHRYPAGDGGAASPRRRAPGAPPVVPPAQQAPAAAQAFYGGIPRPPYQGPRPYQGRAYHPYQCAPGAAQGRGRGRGRRPEIYQAQTPNLLPAVAAPNWPDGNPPNEVHFADDPYGQEVFLPEPPFETWVILMTCIPLGMRTKLANTTMHPNLHMKQTLIKVMIIMEKTKDDPTNPYQR